MTEAVFINAVCAGTPVNSECDYAVMPVQVIGGPTVPTQQRATEISRFVGSIFEHVVKTGHDVFVTRARPGS